MTVSLAMIVKDEEQLLARCLDSVAAHVDEIVVVDTGSIDATKAVARRYTDRIFDFAWTKDFSAARQFAFDHATSDWVFWLDADDVVSGAEHIRSATAATGADTSVFFWRYIVARDQYGNLTSEYWRERCVRRSQSRWQGRIHETLATSGPVVYDDRVVVEHLPIAGKNNLPRNIDILESALREEGEQPRLLYYLGRDYATAGSVEKALEALQRYVTVSTWDDERYQALVQIAELERRQEHWNEAVDVDLIALKVKPAWPDAYFGLAKTYYFLKDWPKVVHWSEIGEMMAEPQTLVIINPMDYHFNWLIYYTNALYHVGRIEDALRWTREALTRAPEDPWHRENEGLFSTLLRESAEGSRVTAPDPSVNMNDSLSSC